MEIHKYNTAKTEIHSQCGYPRYSKQWTRFIIFKQEEMFGILDLRSLGYYKIKQDILQQNLSKYYKF